ncbi:RsmB/NOP family class I SAM-dependent RNA methyltransferase [Lichenicoccus sp.]|uniref:RsmB/NOP family class I SAM-dependent RNA methyltransferase n=1 Tax=Lichenicoccus sp. TaxID=2781899 RepID=UPI003D0D7D68
MTPPARLAAAIALLEAIEASPRRPADAVANGFFRDRRYIGGGDRRAVADQVWFVLRHWRRLAWWIERVGGETSPRLLAASMAVLEGRPAESVARAFSGGRYAPDTLEAAELRVLDALNGHTIAHPEMDDAVRLEVPDWLLGRLQARFGNDIEAELAALTGAAPLDLRVNLLRGTREAARASLAEEAIESEPTPLSPWGLRVRGRQNVTATAAFKSGLLEIQDEGSQLVVAALDAGPEMRVVDYCAGAGGKTLGLAMTMGNRGHIVACDVSAPRLEGAVRRLRRAGVHNVERHLIVPGDKWAKRRAASFDRVLVDAPCTGTGTWRRNPDARLRLREQDLAELVVKQADILQRASALLRPGGMLVYATCSVLAEENELQIEAFRAQHPAFSLVAHTAASQYLRLTPRRDGTDGFFAARLARNP